MQKIVLTLLVLLCGCVHIEPPAEEPILTIGLIADVQYADRITAEGRWYRKSPERLREAVAEINSQNPDFTVQLGDLIDKDFKSFDPIMEILEGLNAPLHHLLGNHDYSVSDANKSQVPERMGLTENYYHFDDKGWRFIFLDGNQISLHAYPQDSDEYKAALDYHAKFENAPTWNGALGSEQLEWLDRTLTDAPNAIIFCHYPVYPANQHNLWDADELIAVLESHQSVKAYISGHNHRGNYGEMAGIHYLTMKGMVEMGGNAYSLLRIYGDALLISGTGRERDRLLEY